MMRWRVVCALDVMMDMRSPTNAFINVDLPTLGLPTMFTNPDLNIIHFITVRQKTNTRI